jgi:hypothetical protein
MKMNLGIIAAGIVGLVGCGTSTIPDITNRQVDAVNSASERSCNRYDACGKIGAGKKYETRAACESDNDSFWNGRWDAADCDGHINGDALDVCLTSIDGTECNSGLDQLETAFLRCAKSDVCK